MLERICAVSAYILSRLYEDFALSDLNKERYKKMTANYEAKQERLKLEIEVTEE